MHYIALRLLKSAAISTASVALLVAAAMLPVATPAQSADGSNEIRIWFYDPMQQEDLPIFDDFGAAEFSVPKPAVILDPIVYGNPEEHPGKTVIQKTGLNQYRIRLSGTVFDQLTDTVADGKADITTAILLSDNGGVRNSKIVDLDVIEPELQREKAPHPAQEAMDQFPALVEMIRPFPFAARFQTDAIPIVATDYSTYFSIGAGNVNNSSSFANINIEFEPGPDTQDREISVALEEQHDVGLYNPVVVMINDPSVTPENVNDAVATLNGKAVGLRFIDGKLQLDRPIVGLNYTPPEDIPNLVNVVGEPDDFTIKYKTETMRFSWGYTQ